MMETLNWTVNFLFGFGVFAAVYAIGRYYGYSCYKQDMIDKLKAAELERDTARTALYKAEHYIKQHIDTTPESITSTLDGLVSLDAKLVDFLVERGYTK